VDVFHEPGNTDLTANVDFEYLKEAMADLVAAHGPIDQRTFLNGMGLPTRLQGLLKRAETQEQKERLQLAASRLVDVDGMGGQYQVLGITNARQPSEEGVEGVPIYPFVGNQKDSNDNLL
jgi:NADH dehydrogenase [ubiquinone] 1 alpha subcomplex assembly factor 7